MESHLKVIYPPPLFFLLCRDVPVALSDPSPRYPPSMVQWEGHGFWSQLDPD